MSFQSQFLKFHQLIQLAHFDENATLREKRDRVLTRLRSGSPRSFEWFNQGSYAMGTGVEPVRGDYDIDVGVVYSGSDRPDPLTVKGWVYGAVADHTSDVEWRRPCVTVWYRQGGERIYHVDLAIYWKDTWGQLSLAVGKQHSGRDQVEWQGHDPRGLIERVCGYASGEDRNQFRRVIRYLKRWKDNHFSPEGHASPVGIGLTAAALSWFQAVKQDPWASGASSYDDMAATQRLVQAMRRSFVPTWHSGEYAHRLRAALPVAPRNDVFERMTNQQMKEFAGRLERLDGLLDRARVQADANSLRVAFGDQFPTT